MFVQCSKRLENFYYIISIRTFQKPMSEYANRILKYKIPNFRLHLWLWLQLLKFFHLRLWLRLWQKKSPSVDRWPSYYWTSKLLMPHFVHNKVTLNLEKSLAQPKKTLWNPKKPKGTLRNPLSRRLGSHYILLKLLWLHQQLRIVFLTCEPFFSQHK